MLMTLDHFYGGAGELFSFYRIPKALFLESRFLNLSAGWTSRAESLSSTRLRMSRGHCVAQTTKRLS